MSDVRIGPGKLAGKGVYAARDFAKGEVVLRFHLKQLTEKQFLALPKGEDIFVHSFWAKRFLFPVPERYVNHSAKPNMKSDILRRCDMALRAIKKGEMITINATHEVRGELVTFVEVYERTKRITNFAWVKGGYRNAFIRYVVRGKQKTLTLKRVHGNWEIVS